MDESNDILGMSDEEFLKSQFPTVDKDEEEPEEVDPAQETAEEAPTEVVEAPEEPEEGSDSSDEPEAPVEAPEAVVEDPTDYKELYHKVVAPFKANGRVVDVKTPDEAIKLMQMGANYTKKMQSIAPYKKTILMLEKHGLLDQDKLSFLIDLDKKDPKAIQKFLKDSQIDPLDIDLESESDYTTSNHQVSDQEAALTTVVDEIKESEYGQETLVEVNRWDQASKEVLWESPELLHHIRDQIGSGVYKQISDEVDRQRMLGSLNDSVSFIQAYRDVGQQLLNAGELKIPGAPAPIARSTGKPRVTEPKNTAATRASASRSSNRTVKPFINPLAMSDEDFLKQFEGRV